LEDLGGSERIRGRVAAEYFQYKEKSGFFHKILLTPVIACGHDGGSSFNNINETATASADYLSRWRIKGDNNDPSV
jgi:hypothetical protein